jgi:hypothetical protein
MTARANRMERRNRDARRSKMAQERQKALLANVAGVIKLAFVSGATASIFGLEGPIRSAVRAGLCLQGWHWFQADMLARGVLSAAFDQVRAERPSWNEGQREWTIEAGTLIERTRCARCHKKLPEGNHKFCSRVCNTSHASRQSRFRQANEDQAVQMAVNLD